MFIEAIISTLNFQNASDLCFLNFYGEFFILETS